MTDQHCVIFNWNVRSLNNSARRQVVFNSVRDTRATIVALQETKLEHIDRQMVYEILGTRFVDNYVVLSAIGTRGGILLAVDEDHFRITRYDLGVHSVTATILAASGLVSWCLTVVYGPQEDQAKMQFLGELRWIQQCVGEKWLVLGDFNLILEAEDRSNANVNRRLMGAFKQVVCDLSLKELQL
jgi:exonuclease III